LVGEGQNWLILKNIRTKLNKTREYRNKIEYKTLTLTRDMLLGWHMDILKKIKKNYLLTQGRAATVHDR